MKVEQEKSETKGNKGSADEAESAEVTDVRSVVQSALERRRGAIVYRLAERFSALLKRGGVTELSEDSEVEVDRPWTKIESLSQLRSTVGGRFQNLKQRWVEAGFPLREHRGDRSEKPQLDEDGWVELVRWINQQGYEARLAADKDPWIFEVRTRE